jgi:hypothetical protein
VNSGFAIAMTPDAQVDVQLGRSIRNGSGWTLTSGVVVRRPTAVNRK